MMKNKSSSLKSHLSRSYNAISLFSGGGGLDLGAEAAGITTRVCIDNDKSSCETLEFNQGKPRGGGRRFLSEATILCADITKLKSPDILKASKVKREELDLIYGGPPCQAFSVFGKRKGLEDPRGTLLMEFVRIVHDLQPKVFILENVPGLETIAGGKVYKDLVDLLKKKTNGGKYEVTPFLVNVADYGVPQKRERIIIIGTRGGKTISAPPTTHGIMQTLDNLNRRILPYNTVGMALGGLPNPGHEEIPNHIGRTHSKEITNRYAKLAYGERDSSTRINRLHPDKPSFTIIVGSEHGGGKGHVHPFEPREVTPRESARLQTFPDDWEFTGSKRNVIRQVGNAVPTMFAAQLFSHVLREVFKEEKTLTPNEMAASLGQHHLHF